ncbi:MAG: MFS transporter [Promethearchaeota archaeon]|nr:MAG: MFS transporter [Candidatus Lokiarchaeota archaeon]
MNDSNDKLNEENNSDEIKYSSAVHWSYGIGGFFTNFIAVALGVRLIFFYENVLLLDIVLIGIALIILGFWNMVNDPLMGYFSDKNYSFNKKWGRRFPWFVPSAILCCVFYALVFLVPFRDPLGMFLWLIMISCIYELMYSTWNTNYVALFPEKFRSEKERTKVGGINTITGQFGVALGILIPPLIIIADDLNSYVLAGFIVMIIGIIVALSMIPGMREDESLRTIDLNLENDKTDNSFLQSLKYVVKQKNMGIYLFTHLAHQVLTFLMLASFPFWTVYILETDSPTTAEILMAGTFLIGGLISVPLWIKIGRKRGNRKGYMYGTLATSIFFIPMLFVSDLLFTIITVLLLGIGVGAIWTLAYPTFSDVIDENVLLTNQRQEGVYNGIRMFVGRFAAVINGVAFVIVHTMTNYKPGAETQGTMALWGIRVLMALIPMIFYFAAFLVMWKFYDLTPDKTKINQKLLKEKGF